MGTGSPAVNAPGGLASAAETPRHAIEISGWAILTGAWTQTDPQLFAVGRNDGFAMGNARIELTGRPADSLWLYVSIDGAQPVVGSDPTQGVRQVQLEDAYGVWAPGGHVRVQAGQFKAPQDVEELLEATELKFVSRSIVSQGVDAPFGY
ncbi:MAG TPA: porin, partial [Myxococcales bacterium]|nr:porin [Myxococcales bacterium]